MKVQVKKTRIDTLVDPGSQANLIVEEYVLSHALTTQPHPHTYPLGWVHKNSKLEVTQQCKLKFGINRDFIDEVLLDVVPLDICGIVLGSPYLWDRDALSYKKMKINIDSLRMELNIWLMLIKTKQKVFL